MFPFLFASTFSACFESKEFHINLHSVDYVNCSTGVLIDRSNLITVIISCHFLACYTQNHGAGILFNGVNLTVLTCNFDTNIAPVSGSAIYASPGLPNTYGHYYINESYAVRGTSEEGTCYFGSESHLLLSHLNLSHNTALSWGSVLAVIFPRHLSVDFCIAHSNGKYNCFLLEDATDTHRMRCLSICGNTCHPSTSITRAAMFCIMASLTLSDSVFSDNDVTFLVSQYITGNVSTLSLQNCHFDSASSTLATFGAAALALNCTVGGPAPDARFLCVAAVITVTPAARAPRTATREVLVVHQSFLGPVVAIASGAAAFAAFGVAVMVWVRRRRASTSTRGLSVGLTEDDDSGQAEAAPVYARPEERSHPCDRPAYPPDKPASDPVPYYPPGPGGGAAYASDEGSDAPSVPKDL
jgi:hypothetical protein